MDKRQQALNLWGINQLQQIDYQANEFDSVQYQIDMISGDASFRRYFRASRDHLGQELQEKPTAKVSWILVDAPPTTEDNHSFVSIARHWCQYQVDVPTVYAVDYDQGFMLLEDFGDQMFWPQVHLNAEDKSTVTAWYQLAIDELQILQQVPADSSDLTLPLYDRALLLRECELFRDWLCQQQLAMDLSDTDQIMLDQVFQQLIEGALGQPQVTVHRDYHSRNIMLRQQGTSHALGLIDFQDAVKGAYTYDLVSLVRDCYVNWPEHWSQDWLQYFWQTSPVVKQYDIPVTEFQRHVDWMGMQRHLKAAGIFARLNLRDGKAAYLADIPNTLNYLMTAARKYPEFAEFANWLESRVMSQLSRLEQPA